MGPTHKQRMDALATIIEVVSRSDDFTGCDVAVLEWAADEIERLRQDAFDCSRGDAEQIAGLHEVIGGKEAEIERLRGAIRRGGWDISPCGACGEAVACLPDGLPMCEACAEREASGPGGDDADT